MLLKNPSVPNYRLRIEFGGGRQASIVYGNDVCDIISFLGGYGKGCKTWNIYSNLTDTFYFPIGKDVCYLPKEEYIESS